MARDHHLPAGTLGSGQWNVELTPERAGWAYSGLRVVDLDPGGTCEFGTGEDEMAALPLSGQAIAVECDGRRFVLAGRDHVFAGPTDFAYLPRDADVRVTATAGPARIAFPSARCENRLAARYVPASKVPVELRGAGRCSRAVRNFMAADVFDDADKLIAVEVVTPGGNWSSYPPHKHDTGRPGEESVLEEIYYFEVGGGDAGMAYQRVYGTPEWPIDVLAEVRSGDLVTIPHGWHGPSMATPGYDLYYLNVMAGPSPDRAWLICDDPEHTWIRSTWADQPIDDRLTGAIRRTDEHGGTA